MPVATSASRSSMTFVVDGGAQVYPSAVTPPQRTVARTSVVLSQAGVESASGVTVGTVRTALSTRSTIGGSLTLAPLRAGAAGTPAPWP
ncbi:hypothetical protein [Streptomyces sp. NPDC004270]